MYLTGIVSKILVVVFYRGPYSHFAYPVLLDILTPVIWLIFAYLIGSIPIAWLLAKWITDHDLRTLGSGNVGVMNTAISVARWAGLVAFLAEITKGIIVILVPSLFGAGEPILCLSVLGVVLGTRWPFWLRFKGGRGNTAGFTSLLLISYPAPVISLALWSLARMLFKTSFAATRLTILSLPLVLWMSLHSWYLSLTGVALALIYLHSQKRYNDDHLLLKQDYSSFWKFLFSPPRH